jgi:hypothetical protein
VALEFFEERLPLGTGLHQEVIGCTATE